jgi:hypothetical protein
LIAAAMACGFAILVAAVVWLFLERHDRQVASRRDVGLQPATQASVGSVRASANQLHLVDGVYVITVTVSANAGAIGGAGGTSVAAGGPGIADLAAGWGLVTTGKGVVAVKPVPVPASSTTPCLGRPLAFGATATCDVAFGPAPTSGAGVIVVTYLNTNARATWQFPAPN